jgi:Ni,Fe-hydrogenase III component G
MSETELARELKAKLGDKVLALVQPRPRRIFFTVKPEDVPAVVRVLWDEGRRSRFATVTGVDVPEGIELLYHFAFDSRLMVVTVKTKVPKPFPEIESITPMIIGAEWIEREIYDILGVKFRNHPNPKRLLLSDDWPEGVYPLRKDFKLKEQGP